MISGVHVGLYCSHHTVNYLLTMIQAINQEAGTPRTSPVPKVSLTLSMPGDVFKPAETTGFEKWLNMFKASSIFFCY